MNDRQKLSERAVQALRQEIPEALEWLLGQPLPKIHWRDRQAVDPRVLRGWLVLAEAHGEPTPSDEHHQQAALLDADDRGDLALWLLDAWIGHEAAPTGPDAARLQELRQIAERAAQLAQRMGRGGTDPEDRYQQLLVQEANQAAPSSLPHRGLLAIVAACGDARILPPVQGYWTQWHPNRPEQCRTLVSMLESMAPEIGADACATAREVYGL